MTTISIEPAGFALGARVRGLDLSRPVDDDAFAAVHRAWLDHLLLVFPGQRLEAADLVRFSSRFGELDDFGNQSVHHADGQRHVMMLTNRPQQGRQSKTYNAGQNWHTDQSYSLRPSKATSVYCIERPSVGGDTMFANMYAAFETLSPTLQAILEGLSGVHDASLIEGLDKRGPEVVAEFKRRNPPVVHPAVLVHPETGRKALYVNERVRQFEGMSEAESQPLIRFLCQHAVAPRRVYRHAWSVGDLVMWDNRCLMHMAIGDYDPNEFRHMFRTSGFGERVGRLAAPGAEPPAAAPAPAAGRIEAELAALRD